jgi:hypothetical protein
MGKTLSESRRCLSFQETEGWAKSCQTLKKGKRSQKLKDRQQTVSEIETCPERLRITKARRNMSNLSHFAEIHSDKKTKKLS